MPTITADGYFLTRPGHKLERGPLVVGALAADQALVQVLACGVCHTDLGFADGSVRPNHDLPLVLGHEVVGRVVDAGAKGGALLGQIVLVPAVLPCGQCAFCAAGRGNACLRQLMPGNDIHGGFASHMVVPVAPLVPIVGAPVGFDVRLLAVVADAVSTAWQAVARAGLGADDCAIVLGAGGGVGGYLCQIARARGAAVVACDLDAGRLAVVGRLGPGRGAFDPVATADLDAKALRKRVHGLAAGYAPDSLRWKIFECSGTPAGQLAAFGLLARAATLVQVGFTPQRIEVRWSNLMAFDATVHGTWGCPVEAYPGILQAIFAGDIAIAGAVELGELRHLQRVLDAMAAHTLTRRMVLCP